MSFDGFVLTVLAVVAGVFVGLARGGRFRNIVGIPVRAKGLLVIGMVVPAFADQFTREVAVPLVVGGLAALLAFAIVNVRIVGMSVMAVGILANLLATFLNGGLPVSRDALVEAGLATRAEVDRVELRGARRLEEPTHRVRFLGDIIPLEETSQVLAFGDLVILVGLSDIAANLTLRKRKQSRAVDAGDAASASAAPPVDDAVAVIDLVRLHVPRGTHNPRPQPHDASGAHPDTVSEPPTEPAIEHAVASSPDVDWWPASPVDAAAAPIETVEAPMDVAPLVPELLEEPTETEEEPAREVDAAVERAAETDAPPDSAAEAEIAPDIDIADPLHTDTEPATETDLGDDTDTGSDFALAPATDTDDAIADELVAQPARPRLIDLDLDLRWAPEPAADIDLRDPPSAAEPQWAPEPEPAAARELSPVVPSAASADDDLFQLLFADLSKARRNRRHGERTIPDFEPVHVDDNITLRGR